MCITIKNAFNVAKYKTYMNDTLKYCTDVITGHS